MPYLSESEYYELNREVAIHRDEAYTKGYAQGLEAAANTVRDSAMPYDQLALLLNQEARRVREMGIPTEVAK